MPKFNGNEALSSMDKEIEALAQSNFELDLDSFFKEEMPKVISGDYYDSEELKTISIESILDPEKKKTVIEERLRDAADLLCGEFGLPESIFSPLAMLIMISITNGKVQESKALTNVLFAHIAYRSSFDKAPSKIGALGGRPSHPRKEETLGLARQRWKQLPRASVSSVATYVKSQLDDKYTDAPKLPSIKSWLKGEKTSKLIS